MIRNAIIGLICFASLVIAFHSLAASEADCQTALADVSHFSIARSQYMACLYSD